jgi:hypothetical protein
MSWLDEGRASACASSKGHGTSGACRGGVAVVPPNDAGIGPFCDPVTATVPVSKPGQRHCDGSATQ